MNRWALVAGGGILLALLLGRWLLEVAAESWYCGRDHDYTRPGRVGTKPWYVRWHERRAAQRRAGF